MTVARDDNQEDEGLRRSEFRYRSQGQAPDIAIGDRLTESSRYLRVDFTPTFPADRRILSVENTPATGSALEASR